MRLADYVMAFLKEQGVQVVFMLPGGGSMYLVDALGLRGDIEYFPLLHEQALAIAADSYAQHTNKLAVVLVTTGPGTTNTLTGLVASYIDSTPVLFISGQVKRSDLKKNSGVRQMGAQEVDIISIVQSVTKYAKTVTEPQAIRSVLEEACYQALSGRRGPVWVDIPLDVQAMDIDAQNLVPFLPPKKEVKNFDHIYRQISEKLQKAKRPLLLAGNGVKLSSAEKLFEEFRQKLQLPTLLTWKTIDLLDFDDTLYFGTPGAMGGRFANFILQNADLLLVFGSRLDSSLTAFNHVNFAKNAEKILIDIDKNEMAKLAFPKKIMLEADVKEALLKLLGENITFNQEERGKWLLYCRQMKDKYPAVTKKMYEEHDFVNAHVFIETLSKLLTKDDIIVPESSGAAGEITYQAFRIKKGQKMKNAAGLGSMGFGLAYAIGATVANDFRRTILINGDGAFQLNIQELATVSARNLPLKIFIWSNDGYASIRNTQDNFFHGHYVASNRETRLYLPDIVAVARAYGLKTFRIVNMKNLEAEILQALTIEGPVLVEVLVNPKDAASPRAKAKKLPTGEMVSSLLEDMYPFLEREEIAENMLS